MVDHLGGQKNPEKRGDYLRFLMSLELARWEGKGMELTYSFLGESATGGGPQPS